jgi:hypothetical protein
MQGSPLPWERGPPLQGSLEEGKSCPGRGSLGFHCQLKSAPSPLTGLRNRTRRKRSVLPLTRGRQRGLRRLIPLNSVVLAPSTSPNPTPAPPNQPPDPSLVREGRHVKEAIAGLSRRVNINAIHITPFTPQPALSAKVKCDYPGIDMTHSFNRSSCVTLLAQSPCTAFSPNALP